ncbi:MAG: nucleolar complex protein 2 homolog, partial [archaeon]|nr:nucleolar complex protein 2 homolog [archaeon]
SLNFMANCVTELFGLDFVVSYQQGFSFIRQLAIHFRTALVKKTKQSYLTIYNWQYLNSLKVFVNILCRYPGQEDLSLLVYPVVQLIIGAIELVPSPRFYPLRLHYVGMLIDLVRTIPNLFIPTSGYLFDVLEHCVITKPRKEESKKKKSQTAPNMLLKLKLTKEEITSHLALDSLFSTAIEGLVEHFYACAYSPGFPELIVPACIRLKKLGTKCHLGIFKKRLYVMKDKLQEQAKFITALRSSIGITPAKTSQINALSVHISKKKGTVVPFEPYYQTIKAAQKEARAALMMGPSQAQRSQDDDAFEEPPTRSTGKTNKSKNNQSNDKKSSKKSIKKH